jgi:hypothetical protein
MFSSFRNRFGFPGVIAVIALVFAMIGGAYAASGGLTSKQKKEVKAIAKSFQGTGPAGVAGPAGANGKDGANGSNGQNGAPGKDGASVTSSSFGPSEEPASEPCEERGGAEFKSASPAAFACNGEPGSPWTAGGTLPPNATETGTWSASTTSGTISSISFPVPLAAEIPAANVHYVTLEEQANDVQPAECTGGTAADPKAAAGNLCVYAGKFFTANEQAPNGIFKDGSLESGSGKAGAAMFYGVPVQAFGSFAVTAP